MSIAVSVVINPARRLFNLVAGVCLGAATVGLPFGSGSVGEWSVWSRTGCSGSCIVLAVAGLLQTARRKKTYHVDISGAIQISLRADGAAAEHSARFSLKNQTTMNYW